MADGELEIFQILRECNECNECNERNEQALHHGFQSRDSRTDEMQIDPVAGDCCILSLLKFLRSILSFPDVRTEVNTWVHFFRKQD